MHDRVKLSLYQIGWQINSKDTKPLSRFPSTCPLPPAPAERDRSAGYMIGPWQMSDCSQGIAGIYGRSGPFIYDLCTQIITPPPEQNEFFSHDINWLLRGLYPIKCISDVFEASHLSWRQSAPCFTFPLPLPSERIRLSVVGKLSDPLEWSPRVLVHNVDRTPRGSDSVRRPRTHILTSTRDDFHISCFQITV